MNGNSVTRLIWTAVLGLFFACASQTRALGDPKVAPTSTVTATVTPAPSASPAAKLDASPTPQVPVVNVDIDSPTQVIQKYTKELTTIVNPTAKKKGERDADVEQKIAEKVRQFFDFQTLARLSLGRHWIKATQAQRDEFSKLFIDLIEESYLKRSRDLVGAYDITYGSEEVKGNRAKVVCKVARNDADVEIVYELHKNPNNWMIYNISLDNVDLVRNYQTQFNSIIEKSGFEAMLKKLRKKAEAAEQEVTL